MSDSLLHSDDIAICLLDIEECSRPVPCQSCGVLKRLLAELSRLQKVEQTKKESEK